MDRPRTDAPRTHREPGELERKRTLLGVPHIAPLTAFAEELRARRGTDDVPYFDPVEAGTDARILVLLEAPGPRAAPSRGGSGFVSPDNDSGTSENLWRAHRDAGLDRRREVATWNVVPWYLGSPARIRAATAADVREGRPHLEALLGLLPRLRVVLLLGRHAARGWVTLGSPLPAIESPHPSPTNLAARGHLRPVVTEAFRAARRAAAAQ